MKNYRCPLEPGSFYHVFNRGNNSQKIFFSEKNYSFFKKRFQKNVIPLVDLYAWCLMPNHFHFVVRIKEKIQVFDKVTGKSVEVKVESHNVSRAFQKLFTGYSKAINKEVERHGSLFEKPYKRVEITSDEYLRSAIIYVHRNPVHHEFTSVPEEWKFSSYSEILMGDYSFPVKEDVISLFDDRKNFILCHKARVELEEGLTLE